MLFPLVLFSPNKISLAIKIISTSRQLFNRMFTMIGFSCLVAVAAWAVVLFEGYMLITMYTSGTPSASPSSFFYLYQGVYLSHPALLTFYFFGVYWFFATLVSWHRYFLGSNICIWYFQEKEKIYPIKRGLKRSWYHLGTASIDALLMPFQWILLVLYSLAKVDEEP